ncbi:hypothetical protein AC578_9980 [Pseudocercospora eumusae]|uniref:3'-5' exonuclease domain-containing protein n=1 Tax=Pseudocercospora eumusae TaxID=321146 RepID=A0A139HM93_9PEZI|nr:hypothetical protein AC578_9980 [Pseudocercospora eumusae]
MQKRSINDSSAGELKRRRVSSNGEHSRLADSQKADDMPTRLCTRLPDRDCAEDNVRPMTQNCLNASTDTPDQGVSQISTCGTNTPGLSAASTKNKRSSPEAEKLLTSSGNAALEKAVNQILQIKGNLRKIQKDLPNYLGEPDLEARLGLVELEDLVESIGSQVRRAQSLHLDGGEDDEHSQKAAMNTLPAAEITLVDTVEQVSELVRLITESAKSQTGEPAFYFDCEGKNLGRNGTVTLLAIYIPDLIRAFVVDLQELGHIALTTEEEDETLKTIFESPTILKGVFDCRGDSEALFAHHNLTLDGIVDVQLMEAATRKNSKRLFGLDVCIKNRLKDLDPSAKAKFAESKDRVKELMRSGDGSCFAERPLPNLLLEYAASDVIVLPILYEHFAKHECYWGEWPTRVTAETNRRLELSRQSDYDPSTLDMRAGPAEWVKMPRTQRA